MSLSKSTAGDDAGDAAHYSNPNITTAAFSPALALSTNRQRKTVVVHRKSPLLVATPPQITRALAFSHPFILPLSKLLGLLSWSSGDPWESFLLVASFWTTVLYGDYVIRFSGPLVAVLIIIAAMYMRRFSPLSTTGANGDDAAKTHRREPSESSLRHQKSLDEIVDALGVFTSRCNILLDPFLQFTDFLSTQISATSATTRPALTNLLLRIVMILPLWICLSWPALGLITTRRVVLVSGTVAMTWHSRPARISRTILWRSFTVRWALSILTGLDLLTDSSSPFTGASPGPRRQSQHELANSVASGGRKHNEKRNQGEVRFTFVLYQNQRRWLGLGWTSSMLAYERAAWTDEHLNAAPAKDKFQLPAVEGGSAAWRWVPGSDWRTELIDPGGGPNKSKSEGWIFYDNKWNDGRRQDGWGRYTRRRKWLRDAELVDVDATARGEIVVEGKEGTEDPTSPQSPRRPAKNRNLSTDSPASVKDKDASDATTTGSSLPKQQQQQQQRRGMFRRGSRASTKGSVHSQRSVFSDDADEHRSIQDPNELESKEWSLGDEMKMGLG